MKLLSVNYSASAGRCVLGDYDGDRLELSGLYEFENEPVYLGRHLRHDLPRLFHELKNSMSAAVRAGHSDIASMGISAWGSDFGLLDEYDELIGNPFHYHDALTENTAQEVSELIPPEELFERTGVKTARHNSLYQLFALKKRYPGLYERAKTLLFIPDLLGYYLTGIKISEPSIAATSQLMDIRTGTWDKELISKLGLSAAMLPALTATGTGGHVGGKVTAETGLRTTLTTVCGYDTACAVMSLPLRRGENSAFLMCNTWGLLGAELKEPLTHKEASGFTNAEGYGRSICFGRDVMGLKIVQELKREHENRHGGISFPEIDELVREAKPFHALINPASPEFLLPGSMTDKINAFCDRTNQPCPDSIGAYMRCADESLALLYRLYTERLEEVLGYNISILRVAGSGIQNKGLMRMTACALQRPVCAGPKDANATGNIITQLIALGELKNRVEASTLIGDSSDIQTYAPGDAVNWREAYDRFKSLL